MVGYYNTLPFLFGLKQNKDFNLILDVPSKCIEYYSNGEADIALVPVATLLGRSDFNIITDFCIGCNGSVRTVCLFSNTEITSVKKIYLDKDSRTSQNLVKILCDRHWKIKPQFVECEVRGLGAENLTQGDAVLMIGDKVFGKEEEFEYSFDLGIEWKKLTGLPFAFAVWIAKKEVDQSIVEKLNYTISIGLDNLELVLEKYSDLVGEIDLEEYFSEYIDFSFDDDKKKALELFFEYAYLLRAVGEDLQV